eukprot:761469-Hanusia_phi.AAC.3
MPISEEGLRSKEWNSNKRSHEIRYFLPTFTSSLSESSILRFAAQQTKPWIDKKSNGSASQDSTRTSSSNQLTAAQIDRARRKLLMDAFEDSKYRLAPFCLGL